VATVPKAIIVLTITKQYKYHLYTGKRQVFLKPLTPIRRKLPLNYKKAITVLGKVLSK
jgi:hypothetical protein